MGKEPERRRVVRYLEDFAVWLDRLRDLRARALIAKRIVRLQEGNFGDCRFLGGISELRLHHGPGYRLYYAEDGLTLVILLCAGEKSTQRADIAKARRLWAECRGGR